MKFLFPLSAVLILAVIFLAVSGNSGKVKTSHLRMTQIAGLQLFRAKECGACHTLGNAADGKLTPIGKERDKAWFKAHVSENSAIVLEDAKSRRKQRRILKREIEALSDFLFHSAKVKEEVMGLPDNIRMGAYIGYQNNCVGCHKIAGAGKEIGPDLTNIAVKHDRAWFISNLKNPQEYAPESAMPALEGKVSEKDLGKVADYLLTLRK